MGVRTCSKCGVEKDLRDFYKYKTGRPHSWCKACLSAGVVRKQRELKIQAIQYKGGKCLDCGTMPHPAAMSFHHRDPSNKDFNISHARTKTLDAVRDELDKCDLLCKNCHAIRHALYEEWDVVGVEGFEPPVEQRSSA